MWSSVVCPYNVLTMCPLGIRVLVPSVIYMAKNRCLPQRLWWLSHTLPPWVHILVCLCWSGGVTYVSYWYSTTSGMLSAYPPPAVQQWTNSISTDSGNLLFLIGYPETIYLGLNFHCRTNLGPTWDHWCWHLQGANSREALGAFKVEVLQNLVPVALPILVDQSTLPLPLISQTLYTMCIPPQPTHYPVSISRTQSSRCYSLSEGMEHMVHACCPCMPSCYLCSQFLWEQSIETHWNIRPQSGSHRK